MINHVTGRAVNRVTGPAIGNSALNLRVRTTMTDVAIQAAIAMLSGNIRQVAISATLCGKKGLVMCKGMIELSMVIEYSVPVAPVCLWLWSPLHSPVGYRGRRCRQDTEAAMLLDSVL